MHKFIRLSGFQRSSSSSTVTHYPPFTTAIYASTNGHPAHVLKVGKIPFPNMAHAPRNSVLVEMLAAPVNPSDMNAVQGTYPTRLRNESGYMVPGFEGVGKVIGMSTEPTYNTVDGLNLELRVGDWVIPYGHVGTWQNHVIIPDTNLLPVHAFSADQPVMETLATVSVNPCSAYRMLHDYVPLRPGDKIIQNAGNSAVGIYVSQIAAHMGVKCVSVVRDRPNFHDLESTLLNTYKAQAVITPDKVPRNPEFRLGLNCVGGNSATDLMRSISKNGTLVTYGGMSQRPLNVPVSALIFRNLTLAGFWMTEWKANASLSQFIAMLHKLCEMKLRSPPFHRININSATDVIPQICASGSEFNGKKTTDCVPVITQPETRSK